MSLPWGYVFMPAFINIFEICVWCISSVLLHLKMTSEFSFRGLGIWIQFGPVIRARGSRETEIRVLVGAVVIQGLSRGRSSSKLSCACWQSPDSY